MNELHDTNAHLELKMRVQWGSCTNCPLGLFCRKKVFGELIVPPGASTDRLVLILGKAPGSDDETLSTPFSGVPGQIVREILQEVAIYPYRLETAISCSPKNSLNGPLRSPSIEEMKACSSRVGMVVRDLKPSAIVALGKITVEACRFWRSDYKGVLLHGPDLNTLVSPRKGSPLQARDEMTQVFEDAFKAAKEDREK